MLKPIMKTKLTVHKQLQKEKVLLLLFHHKSHSPLQIQCFCFYDHQPYNKWIYVCPPHLKNIFFPFSLLYLHIICIHIYYISTLSSKKQKPTNCTSTVFFFSHSPWGDTRVFIGFIFNPMLSGERSSGAMQDGLSGLLGLPVNWLGL